MPIYKSPTYKKVGAAAAPSITETKAITLVKESLNADDNWRIESNGIVDAEGAVCYRIVAVSPEGDACCRLVDACSGEREDEHINTARRAQAVNAACPANNYPAYCA